MNIFEEASRRKFRFPYNGSITVEDLFDLNKAQINKVYQTLSVQVKSKESTLLSVTTAEDKDILNKIEIVKYVFNEKVEKENRMLRDKETSIKKQRIMEVMSKKQDESLENTSMEDLQKMLDEI